MKKIAVCPGSFDPITNGHIDIIQRGAKVFDELHVVVLNNSSKNPLFSVEERMELIRKVTSHIPNVKVDSFQGLLVDYAISIKADAIIRGLRAVSDFEYEMQMSQMNSALAPEINTIFLITKPEYNFISSSTVKEIVMMGGDISKFVPVEVKDYLEKNKNKGK